MISAISRSFHRIMFVFRVFSVGLLIFVTSEFGLVSQHALAGVVEVNEGAESVLLTCRYSDHLPEEPVLMWNRSDLTPKSVHLMREDKDELKGQNQNFTGRTSMNPDALDTRNFSLTLRKPHLSDSGNYTCIIYNGREEVELETIHLKVKDDQEEVTMNEGAESVILPCRTSADLPEDTSVDWTRPEPEFMMVHVFPNTSRSDNKQDSLYRGRTEMNKDLLRTGDASLTLRDPSNRDSGSYICTIYRGHDILRHTVVLTQVKGSFPSWATALLVLLVLVLIVSAGLLFHFRPYFMSEYQVWFGYGVKSVLLPCRTTTRLPHDAKVEWTDGDNRKVHVYQNGCDLPEEQDRLYRNRTEMKDKLQYGDLSLTLRHPTPEDVKIYTCSIYNREKTILMKKRVHLQIRRKESRAGVV